jgi:3-hydroxyacyl-[acyl-carrier-protein] dehydratase
MRFLLVDQILEWSPEGGIRGVKNVAMSEDYLEFHFPGNPVMPGALLLEAMGQLAAWREGAASGFERWFLLDTVRRCGFYGFALPGDRVEFELEPLPDPAPDRRAWRGLGVVDGRKRVAAEFEGAVVPLAELEDPAVQRQMFERLTRERKF